MEPITAIGVGCGPSGPSIEGPFYFTVHLCRALGDRKIEKKSKKKQKNKEKRRKNRKKKRKKWEKKENCRDFVYFLCTSVFLGSFYYLGNKYIFKIRISSFMICKSTNYASQWLLIFCVTSLGINDGLHSFRHGFVEGL